MAGSLCKARRIRLGLRESRAVKVLTILHAPLFSLPLVSPRLPGLETMPPIRWAIRGAIIKQLARVGVAMASARPEYIDRQPLPEPNPGE